MKNCRFEIELLIVELSIDWSIDLWLSKLWKIVDCRYCSISLKNCDVAIWKTNDVVAHLKE